MSKSFGQVAAEWLDDKKFYVKKSTFATYSLLLSRHLLPAFKEKTELSEDIIQDFVLGKIGEGLGIKTIKDMFAVLKMIVKFGAKRRYWPLPELDIKFPTERKASSVEILNIGEQKSVMDFIVENFSFLNLGIYICLCSGMRIGEICALKWKDIDIESGVICVRKTIQRIYLADGNTPHTEILIGSPKSGHSVREIPLAGDLLEMIRPLKRLADHNHYVISNAPHPIEPRTYRNHYNKMMNRLNIPHLKFHGLRHSFATRCIESGCDYKTVSVLLGHSNINTTLNLYVHPDLGQKRRCIDKMFETLR